MRLAVNLFKLAGLLTLAVFVFLVCLLVGAMHYSGINEGLTLLRMDTQGFGADRLLRSLFAGLDGNFTNWAALATTMLVFVGSYMAVALVFRLVQLGAEAPALIADGAGRDLFHTVMIVVARTIAVVGLLTIVLCFDAALFQYRALVGVFGATDPAVSARTVQALAVLGDAQRALGSVNLIGGWAVAGYVSITVLAAVLLEVVFGQIGETMAIIGSLIAPPADEEMVIDADYNEPQDAHALDGPRNPLPSNESGAEALPEPNSKVEFETPSAADAATAPVMMPVIGGAPGETIEFEDAKNDPNYRVTSHPSAVYTRKTWQALQDTEEDA